MRPMAMAVRMSRILESIVNPLDRIERIRIQLRTAHQTASMFEGALLYDIGRV
jgi:hypothetical protein